MSKSSGRRVALFLAACAVVSCAGQALAATGSRGAGASRVGAPVTGDIAFVSGAPGVTPFINFLQFNGSSLSGVVSVTFRVAPAPGATAAPVQVQTTVANLRARGYGPKNGHLTVPVFGLYAGITNTVTVTFKLKDGSTQTVDVPVASAPYTDPNATYDQPTILTPRQPDVQLGYSYMYLKSALGSPVILDVDGAVRWVGPVVDTSFSSGYQNGGFVIGHPKEPIIDVMGLDGSLTHATLDDPAMVGFNHNIGPGREALLASVHTVDNGVLDAGANVAEITYQGHVIRRWDFAKIIGDWMTSHGDDATLFVRPGLDWLHVNAQIYDPRDDSLVISSREEFLMKVDYDTGAIRWIFGDPSKYWATFPSLSMLSLTGPKDKYWPIGQHSVTLRADGSYMIFNNGLWSVGVPEGAPQGQQRPYSAISAYQVDEAARAVRHVYNYEHGRTIQSGVCSSAWESTGKSKLFDYASADDDTTVHLIGVDGNDTTAFEYVYKNHSCATAWHTLPFAFEALSIK
jgi:hypothetical protein